MEKAIGRNAGEEKMAPRNKFIRAAGLAGTLLLAGMSVSCSNFREPPAKMRCYNYEKGKIRVYVEGKEGGRELSLSTSELGVGDAKPLCQYCTYSGHLFWVTEDMLYIRKLSLARGKFKVEKVLETQHTRPDEYAVPGVNVVSADIWKNPDAPWEDIVIATLTNTGVFQALQISLKDLVRNRPNRGIYEIGVRPKKGQRWPAEGISGGTVRILEKNLFVMIPIGEKGKGNAQYIYNIKYTGGPGTRFAESEIAFDAMDLRQLIPEMHNILEIYGPVRYDGGMGGWIANIMLEDKNGGAIPILPILTPE